jgi:Ras-related protein Rab-1A
MLVFDKTEAQTFDHIASWLEEIGKYSETSARMLVGNKQDSAEKCQIDTDKAQTYAQSIGMPYVETSALSRHQVELAFVMLARELIRRKNLSLQGKKGEQLSAHKKSVRKCCHK